MKTGLQYDRMIRDYRSEYDRLRPFFDFVKARLTLDFSRKLRTAGLEGHVFFSVRAKSFPSTVEKLRRNRKARPSTTSLQDLIWQEDGYLKDMVGIRFVCLDERTLAKLIHHILQDTTYHLSAGEYYQSVLNFTPLDTFGQFIESAGFTRRHLDDPNNEKFRRYEDINMHLYFKDIRDLDGRFWGANEPMKSDEYHAIKGSWYRDYINRKRGALPEDFVTRIPRFPIEAQMVTFTMHLFNEIQRPEYLNHKAYVPKPFDASKSDDISGYLESLKKSLVNAERTIEHVSRHFHGPFDHRAPMRLVSNFPIERRIPEGTSLWTKEARSSPRSAG